MRSLFSLEGCAHVDDSQHVVLSTVANELVTCVGPSACATYYVTPVEKQTDFGRIVIPTYFFLCVPISNEDVSWVFTGLRIREKKQ
jgi:hypothetical protein